MCQMDLSENWVPQNPMVLICVLNWIFSWVSSTIFQKQKKAQDIPNPLPILDTLQKIKFFGERRYSH